MTDKEMQAIDKWKADNYSAIYGKHCFNAVKDSELLELCDNGDLFIHGNGGTTYIKGFLKCL